MMTVRELNQDQIDQLKIAYDYEVNNVTRIVADDGITNETIFQYYDGFCFTPEDFCTAEEV